MGRKAKHPSKVRSHQIIAKVTPGEKLLIARQAKREKMTQSEYLRKCAGLE